LRKRILYRLIIALSVIISSRLILSSEKLTTLIILKKDINISASVDNVSPSKNSIVFLTVKGPPMSKITAIANFKTKSLAYPGMIGKDGYASIPIQVINAEPGFTVIVDVQVEYNNKIYKSTTSFSPR
jgi:competence protein ComEC